MGSSHRSEKRRPGGDGVAQVLEDSLCGSHSAVTGQITSSQGFDFLICKMGLIIVAIPKELSSDQIHFLYSKSSKTVNYNYSGGTEIQKWVRSVPGGGSLSLYS